MSLRELLIERRSAILGRWQELMLATYPPGSADLFAKERDPFKNPVGATVRRQTEAIIDGLLGADGDTVQTALDILVQMRAVQDLTPAQATGFVLVLKQVLREVAAEDLDEPARSELSQLEDGIDNLTLVAFDTYVKFREKVFAIRAREAQARVSSLLRQARMVVDLDSEDDEPSSSGAKGGLKG